MAWLKKDQEILAYEVREANENQEIEYNHYCRDCFRHSPNGSISQYITKDELEARKDQRLLCDRCGKEIK